MKLSSHILYICMTKSGWYEVVTYSHDCVFQAFVENGLLSSWLFFFLASHYSFLFLFSINVCFAKFKGESEKVSSIHTFLSFVSYLPSFIAMWHGPSLLCETLDGTMISN